jgi:hypothetical protein
MGRRRKQRADGGGTRPSSDELRPAAARDVREPSRVRESAVPDVTRAQRWRNRERGDLLLLATAVALVPLLWYAVLGWSSGRLVSGHDAVPNALLVARELAAADGDWGAELYRPDLLGGMKLRDAVGPFPPFAWFARAGLGAVEVYNLSVWLVQALLGFLAARAASDLARAWRSPGERVPWWTSLAALLLVAFAPVLGWRVGHGHLNLLTGMLPFAVAFALLAASALGSLSVTLALVGVFALWMGALFTGYQLVLYGAVFGGPILLGLWWALGRRWRALVAPALCLLVAGVVVWPAFSGVLAHVRSSDAARSLERAEVVYSYLTGRWQDVLGSLFWTSAAVPGGQPDLQAHETNVPLGPALLILALIPWRRSRALAVGLAASAAAAVLFAVDFRPVSTGLVALLPALGSFRVPTRALIPFALALPIVTAAALAARDERQSVRTTTLALVGLLVGLWLPSVWREVLVWGVGLAYLWPWLRTHGWLAPSVVALTLAGASIGAFRERLLPFPDAGEILVRCDRLGHAVRASRPALESPLARVSLGFEFPELGPNTAFASGLSSLDGYYYPSRRFLELYWALRNQPYVSSAVLLRFPPGEAWARVFHQLYNVAWAAGAREEQRGRLGVWGLGPTAGAAWFSARLVRVPSMADLARLLRQHGDDLAERARQTAWVVEGDPRLPATLPASIDESCSAARVKRVDAARRRAWMSIDVESPADCPVTLAMNYAETLRATLDGPAGRVVPTFPIYGALTGVLVPPGAKRVWIAPRASARP